MRVQNYKKYEYHKPAKSELFQPFFEGTFQALRNVNLQKGSWIK